MADLMAQTKAKHDGGGDGGSGGGGGGTTTPARGASAPAGECFPEEHPGETAGAKSGK